jgi:hypothetical protein
VLVTVLGSVAFGAWQVCLRLLSYITPGDGPISQALRWVVSNKNDREPDSELRYYVTSAFILWGVLSSAMLLIGIALAWMAPELIRE